MTALLSLFWEMASTRSMTRGAADCKSLVDLTLGFDSSMFNPRHHGVIAGTRVAVPCSVARLRCEKSHILLAQGANPTRWSLPRAFAIDLVRALGENEMGETWEQQQDRLREEASRAEASSILRQLDARASEIRAKLGVQKTDESVPASPMAVSLRDEIRQYKETTLNDLRCSVLDNLLRDDWVSQLRNVTEENWRSKLRCARRWPTSCAGARIQRICGGDRTSTHPFAASTTTLRSSGACTPGSKQRIWCCKCLGSGDRLWQHGVEHHRQPQPRFAADRP
jgi:hypothetical protein